MSACPINSKALVCDICSDGYIKPHRLERHIQSVHEEALAPLFSAPLLIFVGRGLNPSFLRVSSASSSPLKVQFTRTLCTFRYTGLAASQLPSSFIFVRRTAASCPREPTPLPILVLLGLCLILPWAPLLVRLYPHLLLISVAPHLLTSFCLASIFLSSQCTSGVCEARGTSQRSAVSSQPSRAPSRLGWWRDATVDASSS